MDAVDLEIICLRCLQKQATDRYQTPNELARELRRFLDSSADSIPRRSDTKAKPPSPQGGWNRIRVALLGLVALSAVGLAIAAIGWNRANRQSELDGLLHQLESAELAALPRLVPKIDPGESTVAVRLARLFAAGTLNQKFAVALVLAKHGSESSEYCYERLLKANPVCCMNYIPAAHDTESPWYFTEGSRLF